jgi:hypothetical protein
MSPPPLTKIDLPRVTPVRFPDGSPQSIGRLRDGDQVDVVGHQAISPNLHPVLPAPLTHQLQVRSVVLQAKKRLLPTISPLRNVMR